MHSTSPVVVPGPLAPFAAGFDAELARLGYTPDSAYGQLRLAAELSGWLASAGMGPAEVTAETLEVFFKDGRELREDGGPSKSGGADPMAFSHDAHRALITNFLDAIDQDREPRVSGREALKVQVLIEALLRSSAEARAVEVC